MIPLKRNGLNCTGDEKIKALDNYIHSSGRDANANATHNLEGL